MGQILLVVGKVPRPSPSLYFISIIVCKALQSCITVDQVLWFVVLGFKDKLKSKLILFTVYKHSLTLCVCRKFYLLPTLLFHHVGVEWEVVQLGGFRTPTFGHHSDLPTPSFIHAAIASSSTVWNKENRKNKVV